MKSKLVETIGDYEIWLGDTGKTYYILSPDGTLHGRFNKIENARSVIPNLVKYYANRKLYVDDIRLPPRGWDLVTTFHEAITRLERNEYTAVSLDHDLGCYYGNKEMTGRDILNWLIARKLEGGYVPPIVRVHSANPVGCATMEQDIQRYWGNT